MNTLNPLPECRRAISLLFTAVVLVAGCQRPGPPVRAQVAGTDGSVTIHADVLADNWFACYLGEKLLIEDSVSITTERSFNAESFSFKADYPIVLNFVVKDFKENETGLEYIGDGGFIAQFTDATSGKLIAATNANWRCLVLHRGPLDESCAEESSPIAGQPPCEYTEVDEPQDWKSADFSVSDWSRVYVRSSQP
ncbi:hypothetical protein N9N28_17710 [Rubripirellula amarantea]|nr:hypothetical protein [Rubripirellula amarantea]